MMERLVNDKPESVDKWAAKTDKPDDVFTVELSAEMVKRTENLKNEAIDLALRVKEAREFISWSSYHFRTSWFEWMEQSTKATQDMNMLRMAFDRETKHVLATAKDVKEFFSSPEYSSAHAKFSEMVGLLERFEQLKKSGTMDAFADFILKITCK